MQDGEAETVARAWEEFCAHHEIPIMSPKRQSEINLALALGAVYGRIGGAVLFGKAAPAPAQVRTAPEQPAAPPAPVMPDMAGADWFQQPAGHG